MPRKLSQTPKAIAARDLAARKRRGEEVKRGRPVGAKSKPKPLAHDVATAAKVVLPRTDAVPVPRTAASPEITRGAIRRLRALVAIGYTPGTLANRLHAPADAVWFFILTPPANVAAPTCQAIRELYRELAPRPLNVDEHAPRATAIETARQLAAIHDWGSPVAWEDIDEDPEPVRTTLRSRRPNPEVTLRHAGPAASPAEQTRYDELLRELRDAEIKAQRSVDEATRQSAAAEGRLVEARQTIASKDRRIEELQAAADEASIRAVVAGPREYTVQADDSLLARSLREKVLRQMRGQEVTAICGQSRIVGELVEVIGEPEAAVRVALPGMPAGSAIPLRLDAWSVLGPDGRDFAS